MRKSEVLELVRLEMNQELRATAELIVSYYLVLLQAASDAGQAKNIASDCCRQMKQMVENIIDRFETSIKDSFFDSAGEILCNGKLSDAKKLELIREMYEDLKLNLEQQPKFELPNELKDLAEGGH